MSNLSRRKGARIENDVTHKPNHHGIPARKISRMYQSGGRTLRLEVKSYCPHHQRLVIRNASFPRGVHQKATKGRPQHRSAR